MDEPEPTAPITPNTMTAVSTLPTASTSTRNAPRATSTGTASTASVRLSTHKTRIIWQRLSRMWNGNSTRPTIPYRLDGIGLSGRTPKSSLGGYYYDETAFLPLRHGHQPGGSPVRGGNLFPSTVSFFKKN